MGWLFIIIGIVIRIIAIRKIKKKNYWLIQPPSRLCRNGIYHLIRHPMYLGGLFIGFGLAWVCIGLLGSIPFVWLQLNLFIDRIDREENMLVNVFGEEYIKYINKTKRLIPFIF